MPSTHALTKVTTLSEDDVLRVDLDPDNAAVAETERGVTVGNLLGGGTTAAETAAGVTPIDITKLPSPIRDASRYVSDNTGATDVTAEVQEALDVNKNELRFPDGTYLISSTLGLTNAGQQIVGSNRRRCILKTSANLSHFENTNKATTTLQHVGIRGFLLSTSAALRKPMIDAEAFQFSMFRDMFISGSGEIGNIGIQLKGVTGTTEASHNEISNIVIGNCGAAGVRLQNIANSNTIRNVRCQPPSGAFGIDLLPASGDNLNNVRILDCALEFPGQVSTGIRITTGTFGTVRGVYILGCRFESLLKGIDADPDNASGLYMPYEAQLFSSCTTDIDWTIPAFADVDATPSIRDSEVWRTGAATETITDLDDGVPGKTVTIVSKASVTYNMAGNLTGSDTNIVTANGDTTVWFCENGTLWRLVGFYSDAFNVHGNPQQAYTTGAHSLLRDFTGTTTAAEALQLLESLVDDLKAQGLIS